MRLVTVLVRLLLVFKGQVQWQGVRCEEDSFQVERGPHHAQAEAQEHPQGL